MSDERMKQLLIFSINTLIEDCEKLNAGDPANYLAANIEITDEELKELGFTHLLS